MPPKQVAKGHEEALNEESKAALHESKRLQELAYKGVNSLADERVSIMNIQRVVCSRLTGAMPADAFRESKDVHRGANAQQRCGIMSRTYTS